jgi:NADPH:quinone reductase-like Zn-dependent oxidoreductase
MRLRRIVPAITLALLVLLGIAGAVLVSYNASCREAEATTDGSPTMMRITQRCYGSSDVLKLEPAAVPIPGDDEVLVRVLAASINPQEWHFMTGTPRIMRLSSGLGRPSETRLGADFAGTVEAVGRDVTRFEPGDEVFGARRGAFGEYLVVRADRIIEHKPANTSFEEAAAVGVAATTALQAVRDHGRVQAGQRVLINGASGGVGTYAVQIAKALGAHVTGVSSTRNVELVLSLGADRAIDYTREDFTGGDERYDVIIDMVGNHRLRHLRRVLVPDGIVVIVGGPKRDPWLGPMTRVFKASVYSRFVSQRYAFFIAELNGEDLRHLRDLMESGRMRSVIDQRFALAELPAAMDYLEQGRSRGKNVIIIGE